MKIKTFLTSAYTSDKYTPRFDDRINEWLDTVNMIDFKTSVALMGNVGVSIVTQISYEEDNES